MARTIKIHERSEHYFLEVLKKPLQSFVTSISDDECCEEKADTKNEPVRFSCPPLPSHTEVTGLTG